MLSWQGPKLNSCSETAEGNKPRNADVRTRAPDESKLRKYGHFRIAISSTCGRKFPAIPQFSRRRSVIYEPRRRAAQLNASLVIRQCFQPCGQCHSFLSKHLVMAYDASAPCVHARLTHFIRALFA